MTCRCLLAILGLGVSVGLGIGQAPAPQALGEPQKGAETPGIPAEGTELFRGLFDFHLVVPVLPNQLADAELSNTIIVVLGRPRTGPGSVDAAALTRRCLAAGGSVLIAIDEPGSLATFFPGTPRIEVEPESVVGTTSAGVFSQKEKCPLIVPTKPTEFDLAMWQLSGGPPTEWTLFAGFSKVATNDPGLLRVTGGGKYAGTRLAQFGPDALTGTTRRSLGPERAFAVGGSGPADQPFRCLVMADPGVFSNQMLAATAANGTSPATDNLAFSSGLVTWLTGPGGKRQRCLFLENGRPRDSFTDLKFEAMPSPTPQIPPNLPPPKLPNPLDRDFQQKITAAADESIDKWQATTGPDKTLFGDLTERGRLRRVLLGVGLFVAVLALLMLVRRGWKGRHAPDRQRMPTDTGRVAASGPPGSLARRREEVLQSGNYTAVVREYLRDQFATAGLPDAFADGPRPMPAVAGADAKSVSNKLRTLWEIAYAERPLPIGFTRWKELEPMLDTVTRSAADGRWRFVPPAEPTGGPA